MPGYDGGGSYYDLNQKYANRNGNINSTNIGTIAQTAPLNFLHSGQYDYSNGSLGGLVSFGRYWSSRRRSQTNAYLLALSFTYLSPQNDYAHSFGFSLRCLAR